MMKKLPRRILRPEDQPGYSQVLWQPSWKCFCCRDTGAVSPHLAKMVIEGFDHRIDETPYCQNPSCTAGEHLLSHELVAKTLDMRLNAEICQELDLIERQSWRQTVQQQQQMRQQVLETIEQLADDKNLRKLNGQALGSVVDRTPTEEMEAQQRHAAVLAGWGLEAQNDEEVRSNE